MLKKLFYSSREDRNHISKIGVVTNLFLCLFGSLKAQVSKKSIILLTLIAGFIASQELIGQTTIFSENMGTPTATTTIANYIIGTAPATFQNIATLTYSTWYDLTVFGAAPQPEDLGRYEPKDSTQPWNTSVYKSICISS